MQLEGGAGELVLVVCVTGTGSGGGAVPGWVGGLLVRVRGVRGLPVRSGRLVCCFNLGNALKYQNRKGVWSLI